jgi:bifunctional non-homologous end joining protein LigD
MPTRKVPAGAEWLHEIKHDGYRLACRIDRGDVRLFTRSGSDWTARFPEIRDAASRLGVATAMFDGEAAVVLPDGRTSFQALQHALSGGPRRGLVYFAFDLLHLNGRDLSSAPLEDRKAVLLDLLGQPRADSVVRYSDHITGNGPAFFEQVRRLGLEGIVSKRRDLPYRPCRHDAWLKMRCLNRQEFVVGGFTDQAGSRGGLGALLIGVHDAAGRLCFKGRVGTGFTERLAVDLRRRLETLEQDACPFDPPPSGPLRRLAHWTRPVLVAEVAFTEWTAEGRVRQPSFKGLREDKRADEVMAER